MSLNIRFVEVVLSFKRNYALETLRMYLFGGHLSWVNYTNFHRYQNLKEAVAEFLSSYVGNIYEAIRNCSL
jgi:hypothetical protein